MSTNIFGRDENSNEKYQDLFASVKRIAEKSAAQEQEAKGFKDISGQQQLANVQDTYKQMINKKDENIQTT